MLSLAIHANPFWVRVRQPRHNQPKPLHTFEQAQCQKFLRHIGPHFVLPMSETRQILFRAGRTKIACAALVVCIGGIVGVKRRGVGDMPRLSKGTRFAVQFRGNNPRANQIIGVERSVRRNEKCFCLLVAVVVHPYLLTRHPTRDKTFVRT